MIGLVHTVSGRRGFSLVEVLFAVFVLGLGLLGLASVFPAVIAQQRDAAETVGAASAGEAAVSYLTGGTARGLETILSEPGFGGFASRSFEENLPSLELDGLPGTSVQEESLGYDFTDEGWASRSSMLWQPGFQWNGGMLVTPPEASGLSQEAPLAAYVAEGLVSFGIGDFVYQNPVNPTDAGVILPGDPPQELRDTDGNLLGLQSHPGSTVLPIGARVFPEPYSGVPPRFVWDLVLRRNVSNRVEAAIFIRAFDPGLEVPEGDADGTPDGFPDAHVRVSNTVTRLGVGRLADGTTAVPAERKRLPVGMFSDSFLPTASGARPVVGGESMYAVPLTVEAQVPLPPVAGERRFDGSYVVVRRPSSWDFEDAGFTQTAAINPQAAGGSGLPGWFDLMIQPGQRVVDNLGLVRRVLGEADPAELPDYITPQAGELVLRVSPEYELSAGRTDVDGNRTVPADRLDDDGVYSVAQRSTQLFQLVFTPQVPEIVIVTELPRSEER